MSGISMVLKNGEISKRDNQVYADMVSDTIRDFTCDVNFEMMFNAYQEDTLMDGYLAKYGYFGSKWHADSGGLQVITAGRVITDEIKDKVYHIQAEHSDYAMCFDELPINVIQYAGNSSRIDLSGRQYIEEWAKDKAINTGLNIKKQIKIIREVKSKSKVFVICQGNKTSDFVEFYNNVMDQIPDEYYSSLAGIALSAACTGLGKLEGIKMLGSYKFMRKPPEMGNKLHILGFGSLIRLYPMLLLKESGYLDTSITFDSSSHAICTLLGETFVEKCDLFPKGGRVAFGQVRTPHSDRIFQYLYNKYEDVFIRYYKDLSFTKYLKIVCDDLTTSKRFNLDNKTAVTIHLYTRFLIAYEAYLNFGISLTEAREGIKKNHFDTGTPIINTLINVKTKNDFIKWLDKSSKYVPSNPIQRYETLHEAQTRGIANLESFF